ncbi:hypothetical protein [Spirillospora sp. CA-294931]|uniref:hypothetical protein n=1 Tax=Spirillospora sp. CA-294931 TaxID=3240042 RepID=UPI003D8DDB2C
MARDRGASALEYGAIIAVAVIVIGALFVAVSDTFEPKVKSAVCGLFDTGCQDPGGQARERRGPVSPHATGQPEPGEPSPSPGPPVPQPPPPKEKTETEAVLNETQLGRDALKWVRDNGVNVVYRPGGGSYFSADENTFYVDTNQSPEERANTFVHEVNHAQSPDEPDADDLEKDDYVNKSVEEETEGTVEAIQNNQQLQAKRGSGVPDTLLQQEYEDAYDKAVKDENAARAKNNLPPLGPDGERRVGEKAGRDRVRDAFNNGEIVTSTNGKPYREYYGDAWEDANDCFLWVFC